MELCSLYNDAKLFRRVFDGCQPDLDATIFGKFPAGSCSAASQLLAEFLKERGHGIFTEVSGFQTDSDGGFSSHAWLERHGVIVDVTFDQFKSNQDSVIVTLDRSWHDGHFPNQQNVILEDFQNWSPELYEAYACIVSSLIL